MTSKAYVIGVGMTKFEKPGRRNDFDYPDMAKEAVNKALNDAKLGYESIQQACVGYVYGDSTCGQRALYQVGMTGIPIYNVNNNCSTGSTALFMAYQLINGGLADCVLVLGFEKMSRGSLTSVFSDRCNPMDKHVEMMSEVSGIEGGPITAQMFGNAAKEHMRKYKSTEMHLAKIAYKNHKHSVNNPNSQFRDHYSLDSILSSPTVFGPLTKLQCCPTSDGASAVVVASEKFVRQMGLQNRAIHILGMQMATDFSSTFKEKDPMKLVGYDMTRSATKRLFHSVYPLSVKDVDVVELHDCFSANELISYEALGLCEEGGAGEFIDSGANTYGGRCVVNPSGGLISKGHPLGATGVAQCTELSMQLRNEAGARQVSGASLALQHNIGLGGAVVVALYQRGFEPSKTSKTRENIAKQIEDRTTMAPNASMSITSPSFKSTEVFDLISSALKQDEGRTLVPKVRGVFKFLVNSPEAGDAIWVIDAKNGKGKVLSQDDCEDVKPDVTITMTDSDLHALMTGSLNPQKAFFQGKLKIKGNMGLAMKLQEFQKEAESLKAKL